MYAAPTYQNFIATLLISSITITKELNFMERESKTEIKQLNPPIVTVLMPVYNGERYLDEAIKSILTQTFTDFEFLIIDDNSTDRTHDIIKSYSDSRIRLTKNDQKIGLVESLNKGILLANGEYVARMDADDISTQNRLEKQVKFLDNHPEVGICGSWIKTYGEGINRVIRYPITDGGIRCKLFFFNPFAHPSVIMRKNVLLELFEIYCNDQCYGEDYEMWTRLRTTKFANIPHVLLFYRIHTHAVSLIHNQKQQQNTDKIRISLLEELVAVTTEDERQMHLLFIKGDISYHIPLNHLVSWWKKLMLNNQKKKIYPQVQFNIMILLFIFRYKCLSIIRKNRTESLHQSIM